MSSIAEIRASLEGELAKLDTERDRLASAIALLSDDSSASATPEGPASPTRAARKKNGSVPAAQYSDDEVVNFVQANGPNIGAAAIREHVGGNSNQLSMRLRKLVDGQRLVRSGERRASTYTAVAAA